MFILATKIGIYISQLPGATFPNDILLQFPYVEGLTRPRKGGARDVVWLWTNSQW